MMIDENTVHAVLADINDRVFDGELPLELIDIDIDFLDTEWGFCVDEGDRIILGLTNEFRSRKQMIAIIILSALTTAIVVPAANKFFGKAEG